MDMNLPLTLTNEDRCNFRGCENTIPKGHHFKMCETCRALYVTERLTLLADPFSSREQVVKDRITTQLITAQTAAEVLATRDNLQFLYLEYCKVIKLYGIEPTNKRVKQTLEEQVEDARSSGRNVEARSKANVSKVKESLNKLQKQMKALGCKDPKGTMRNGSKDKDGKVRMSDTCPNCTHEKEAQRIFNDVAPDGDLGF